MHARRAAGYDPCQRKRRSEARLVGFQFVRFLLSALIVLLTDELLDRNPGSLRRRSACRRPLILPLCIHCSPSAQVGQNGVIEEERTFGSS